MSVAALIDRRGVAEIVHFTTNAGCLGALYTRSILSRDRLEGNELVEFLFKANVALRKDPAYTDYISLSFEHINRRFFQTCSESWHRDADIFWVILGLDPQVISHDGVVFSTTNNMYSGTQRGRGELACDQLFADTVRRWAGNNVQRRSDLPANWPTCEAAEALYPGQIPTSFIRHIYTRTEEDRIEVLVYLKGALHPHIDVIVDPDRFRGRPE